MTNDESAARGQPPGGPGSNHERPADPARRQFFRAFGRQTVAGAGNVIGAAETLRRGGTAAASELMGLGFGSPATNAARMQAAAETPPPAHETGQRFSSPYAYSDEAIVLLDQRLLPEERATVAFTEASEVAAALRAGVIGGGPILAEVAAHTLVLAVAAAAGGSEPVRRRAFDTAAETLLGARPTIRAVGCAVARMRAVHERLLTAREDGPAAVARLRREAEAMAMETALDHARLGRLGAETLSRRHPSGRLELLFHGEMGPLSCGLVGTGFAIVRSLLDGGRDVHLWVTDGGPRLRGGALSSLQLEQLEVPHAVIPDAAIGWLLDNRRIDAAVIRLDTVAPDGSSLAPIGAANLARLTPAAGVPVFGCATTSAVGPDATAVRAPELAPAGERRVEPLVDAVPDGLLEAILTEEGVLVPPYVDSIAAAVTARSSRRLADSVTGAVV
jgi:methylthioribose-1-phosphate isomerase